MPRPCKPPSDAYPVAALSRALADRHGDEAWNRFRLATLRHHEERSFESLQAALETRGEWEATRE